MSAPPFDQLPENLRPAAVRAYSEFTEAARLAGFDGTLRPEMAASLPKVWACSRFVVRQCCRYPQWLLSASSGERYLIPADLDAYRVALRDELTLAAGPDLAARLRRFRHCEMLRLAWRDIAGWAAVEDTMRECSLLAEALVKETLAILHVDTCRQLGLGPGVEHSLAPMLVLGMGKLGAWELNFSSDIDLIFAYREEGVLAGRRGTTYGEFYTRLARKLIQALDQVTEDGFVFRVDMRLRPFGDSGPLALNLDAMEIYLQSQAREWERYALVKGRAIAGSAADAEAMEGIRLPFVYRRYLDFRAFGELRDMKAKITLELQRNLRPDNIKLGVGGIREIEFIGQAYQLIRGGREKALQQRGILRVLDTLSQRGHLPAAIVTQLADAYRFLRTVENRLQQFDDEQTHELPTSPLQQQILAYALGFADWSGCRARIDRVRNRVHDVFEQIMASPHTEGMPAPAGVGEEQFTEEHLVSLGFEAPKDIVVLLQRFFSSRMVKNLSGRGSSELNRLMPLALRAVAGLRRPGPALERILDLFEAIASRNVYFSLLAENPLALSQLVKLATGSAWVVHYISQHPILLDELLDPRALYHPLTRVELTAQLAQRLDMVDRADVEQLMVALRQFKQANVLRVAATDIIGVTPLMVVSDYLTDIAEAVVDLVLQRSWGLVAARHGVPPGADPEAVGGFGVVAYGKLGGIELSYTSDLDLVFLHDVVAPNALTDGPGPLSVSEFYARVAKRMVSLMTTQTHAGSLYDIDLRLRPSGNSGLLVSSLEAYETYQLDAAWTWEQQSLVRARFIAGDGKIGERFRQIRERSLARVRQSGSLRQEVREMREKMRAHLAVSDPGVFDLKQGVGGIADIEFLVQFAVLANAGEHPALVRWTDTIRLLDGLREVGFFSALEVDELKRAYCRFRELGHHCALQELAAVVPAGREMALRESVASIWRRVMAG